MPVANIVAEGGSIIYGYGPPSITSFARLLAAKVVAQPTNTFTNWLSRAATIDTYCRKQVMVVYTPPVVRGYAWQNLRWIPPTFKAPIVISPPSIFICHPGDDLAGPAFNMTAYLAYVTALKAYLLARKQKGWHVCVCTVLPRTTPGFEAWRSRLNNEIRTWKGVYCHTIADLAADYYMGRLVNASNTLYYTSGIYPTTLGHGRLKSITFDALKAAKAI